MNEVKFDSQTFQFTGQAGLNTVKSFVSDILSDVRSIKGITVVGFHPDSDNPENAKKNKNFEGEFRITVDNYPFEGVNKAQIIKGISSIIKKIPAVNYFRPSMQTVMEHETL